MYNYYLKFKLFRNKNEVEDIIKRFPILMLFCPCCLPGILIRDASLRNVLFSLESPEYFVEYAKKARKLLKYKTTTNLYEIPFIFSYGL